MSQFMLRNLQKDLIARHGASGANASDIEDHENKVEEIYWSDDDEDLKRGLERLGSPPNQHLDPSHTLSSASDADSDSQQIMWKDDETPSDEDSLDISVEISDSGDLNP